MPAMVRSAARKLAQYMELPASVGWDFEAGYSLGREMCCREVDRQD
jgi:hypothetical protein